MNVFLAILLIGSLLFAAALVAPRLRRGRGRRSASTMSLIAAAQIVLGALWVIYGAAVLGSDRAGKFAGWYAVILGLLWCWQGIRRLAQRVENAPDRVVGSGTSLVPPEHPC